MDCNRSINKHCCDPQEAISQRMDFSQVAILQTVNACQVLLHKLDSSQEGHRVFFFFSRIKMVIKIEV